MTTGIIGTRAFEPDIPMESSLEFSLTWCLSLRFPRGISIFYFII